MRFLTFLYNAGLWIAPPVLLAASTLLIRVIAGIPRARERNTLAQLPLAAEQRVSFAEPGDVILNIQGPLGTMRFASATFRLMPADSNASVPAKRVWFRLRSSGGRTSRTEILRFRIPHAGAYVLHIDGLSTPPPPSTPEYALVFMRPHTASAVAGVLAIVFLAALVIGSLVLFIMRLAIGRARD